jgi:hypothetical protein
MKTRPVSLAVVAALALGAVGAPSFALAGDTPPPPPPPAVESTAAAAPSPAYDYEACRRARANQVAGGVIGAIAGAVLGSNVAGHGAKSEGGVIGGVAGAVIGSQAAKGSAAHAACYGYDAGPPPGVYDHGPVRPTYGVGGPRPYYGYGAPRPYYGYAAPRPRYDAPPPPPAYAYDRDDDRYDRDEDYGYRRVGDGSGADGCKLAESPIFMPDGRTEKRYVRVCADASGRYHVVD